MPTTPADALSVRYESVASGPRRAAAKIFFLVPACAGRSRIASENDVSRQRGSGTPKGDQFRGAVVSGVLCRWVPLPGTHRLICLCSLPRGVGVGESAYRSTGIQEPQQTDQANLVRRRAWELETKAMRGWSFPRLWVESSYDCRSILSVQYALQTHCCVTNDLLVSLWLRCGMPMSINGAEAPATPFATAL